MTFVDLLNHNDYEILNEYPFTIRKKENGKILKEGVKNDGYIRVSLNQHQYQKHRLIALQFIENPDPALLTETDHINRDRSDFHLENLRWVSKTQNQQNKTKYRNYEAIYEDELSENAFEVFEYGVHEYEDLWFDQDKFYYYTGAAFREIKYYNKNGVLQIQFKDRNRVGTTIRLNCFKKLYGFT